MLKVKIGRNGVELYQEGGLNVSFSQDSLAIEADLINVEFDESLPGFAVQVDTSKAKLTPRSSPRSAPRRRNKKRVSDYAEEVFREQDQPLELSELSNHIINAGFQTDSENFANTVRTSLGREPERFVQYDTYIWGLVPLEEKWDAEGKLSKFIRANEETDQEQKNNNFEERMRQDEIAYSARDQSPDSVE